MPNKFQTAINFILALIIFISVQGFAQYDLNKNYVGPTLGLSFLGSTAQVGINYEYSLDLQNIGAAGIGGIFRYWGYSDKYLNGQWNYSDILLGLQGNYHFSIGDDKYDPWVGLVLAYDAGSVSWSGSNDKYTVPSNGGLFLGAQAGLRYWISPTLAIAGRFGFGNLSYGALEVGVDWKL